MGDDTSARLLEAILEAEDRERWAKWADEDVAMFIWAALEPFGFEVRLPGVNWRSDEITVRVNHYGEKTSVDLQFSRLALETAKDVEGMLARQAANTLASMCLFSALAELKED